MELYDYIRYSHYKLGHTIRKIERSTQKSRQTIRKALSGKEPGYTLTQSRPKPVIGKEAQVIKEWLLKDNEAPKKQRHTATRIYHRLKEEYGFKGSYSTVKRTVKQLKEQLNLCHKEGYIPSDPQRREGVEMDWGEAYVDIKGIRTKVYMFCMRAKYSGKIYVKLYPAMVQECFFDGHIGAFGYFGGIFEEIIYDNLKSAVKQVLKGTDRIEQEAFIRFRGYYCFSAEFCNRAKGSDKGGVEGLVGYSRRNFLTPVVQADSLEQINDELFEKCLARDLSKTDGQRQTIGELFEQERSWLIGLPAKPYNNYKLIDADVDKYLTVRVKHNRYSVPEIYVGKEVTVELGLFDVRITYQNKLIATHKREFEKQQWILNPWHYMELLHKKSRAFKSSRILSVIEQDWDPVVKQLWEIQTQNMGQYQGTKDFLESILFFQDKPYTEMVAIFELAIENHATHQESIKILYETLTEQQIPIEQAITDHLKPIAHFSLPEPDVDKFDQLMEEVSNG